MTAYRAEIHDGPDTPPCQVAVFDASNGVEAGQMTRVIVNGLPGGWADLDVDDTTGQWLPYEQIRYGQ